MRHRSIFDLTQMLRHMLTQKQLRLLPHQVPVIVLLDPLKRQEYLQPLYYLLPLYTQLQTDPRLQIFQLQAPLLQIQTPDLPNS